MNTSKDRNITYEAVSERPTLTYHRVGDYYLPDLIALEQPKIGLFGTKRFRYLRDYRSTLFNVMLLSGTLNKHLEEIDQQANDMLELLIRQMAEREGVTEALKARDQMAWVAAMNSIKNRAEEIVLNDLIYT